MAIQNVKLAKISKLFSAFYPSSWMVGADAEYAKTLREAWTMSLDGLFDEQISYGINQIAKAQTPYQKFPPNPQEFRALCQCFKMPEPTEPLKIARALSAEELAEQKARTDAIILNMKKEMKIRAVEREESKRARMEEEKRKAEEYVAHLNNVESELRSAAKARELVADQKISDDIPHQNKGGENGGANLPIPTSKAS